jgi:type III pantothenate kinase
MILTLDVGNSQIFGGVFDDYKLKLKFRKTSKSNLTSDELGIFLKSVLRENDITTNCINHISICSVVPAMLHSLTNCCIKYFKQNPFILKPGSKTGLKLKYKNPLEIGSDRIANAIATTKLYPDTNLIVIDFGTANTFCAISKNKEYLGGLILPGLKISMAALASNTAKLPSVEIIQPEELVARSTTESIQSGLYYSTLVTVKEITKMIKMNYFPTGKTLVIGTGGFARLFEHERLFDELVPDLVLIGLNLALRLNNETYKCEPLNKKRITGEINEKTNAKVQASQSLCYSN